MAVTLDPQNREGKILPMVHLVLQITVGGLITISQTYSGEWLEVSFNQHAYQPPEQTASVEITFHIVYNLCPVLAERNAPPVTNCFYTQS